MTSQAAFSISNLQPSNLQIVLGRFGFHPDAPQAAAGPVLPPPAGDRAQYLRDVH